MRPDDLDAQWRGLAREAFAGMKAWRLQHPTATFREIAAAGDERVARVRARMRQAVALASAAADLRALPAAARPVCPAGGHRQGARGQEPRQGTPLYDHQLTLTRAPAGCPARGAGLSPPG